MAKGVPKTASLDFVPSNRTVGGALARILSSMDTSTQGGQNGGPANSVPRPATRKPLSARISQIEAKIVSAGGQLVPNESRNSMIIDGGVFAAREAQLDSIRKCSDLEKLRSMTMSLFRDLEDSRYESQDLAQTLSHIRAQLAEQKLRTESAEAEKSELESKVQHLTVRLEQAIKSADPSSKSLTSGADNNKSSPAPRMAMTSSRVSQIGPFNSASTDSTSKRAATTTLSDYSSSSTSSGQPNTKSNTSLSASGSLRNGKAAAELSSITDASVALASLRLTDDPSHASHAHSSLESPLPSASDATTADAIGKRSGSSADLKESKSDLKSDKRGKKGSKDKTKAGSTTTSPRDTTHRSPSISPRAGDAPNQNNSSGDDKTELGESGDNIGALSSESMADGDKRRSNPFKRSTKSNPASSEPIPEEDDLPPRSAVSSALSDVASPPASPGGRSKANKDPFKSKPAPELQNFIASDTEGLSRSPVSNPRLAIWNGPAEKKRDRKRTGIDTFGSSEEPSGPPSGTSSPGRSAGSDPHSSKSSMTQKPPMMRAGSAMSAISMSDNSIEHPDSVARRRTSSSSASGDYSAFGSKDSSKKHKKDKSSGKHGKNRGTMHDDIQTDVEGGGRIYRRGASGDMTGVMSIVDPGAKRRPSGGVTHHHQTTGSNRLSMGPSAAAYNAYHRNMSQENILSDHEGTYHSEKTEAKFRAIEARRLAQQARESTYGIAFGVRRGSCEPPCDCQCYVKREESYACGTCSHFPAQHVDMGQVSDGEEDFPLRRAAAGSTAAAVSASTADSQPAAKRASIGSSSDIAGVNASGSGSDHNNPPPAGHNSQEVISTSQAGAEDDAPSIDEIWRLNFSECYFISQLGKGNSSTVFLGEYQSQQVAIKVLRQETHKRDLDDFKKEMEIMCSLRSPYIVHFHGATLAPKLCIVLEYCSQGTLFHYLHDDLNYVDWRLALRWLSESARGINTLHLWKPQIVHRDLKTLNLLLDDKLRIKVCDFGLSRFVSVEHDQSTFFKMRGTFAYFAPEVYQGKPFTSKSDVYSLGIILWEIIHRIIFGSHTRPFAEYKHINHDFQIIIQAAKGLRPTLPFSTPRLLVKLYEDCVAADPEARPTCQEIIERLEQISAFYEEHSDTWDALVKGGVRLRPQASTSILRRRDSNHLDASSGSLTMSTGSAASPNRFRAELLRTPIASRNLNTDLTRRGITASMLREKSVSTSTTPLSGTSSPVLGNETPPGSTSTSAREESSIPNSITNSTTTPANTNSSVSTNASTNSDGPVSLKESSATITPGDVTPPKSPAKVRPGSPSASKRKQKSGSNDSTDGGGSSSTAASPVGSPISKRASTRRSVKPINAPVISKSSDGPPSPTDSGSE